MKPLTRSGYRRARALFPGEFARLTRSRFRSSDDFSPTVLIPNLEMVAGKATLDTQTPPQICLGMDTAPRIKRNLLLLVGRLQHCHLLCLNNADHDWHTAWLSRHFNIPPLCATHK
jgi:hypothetical protein